MPNVSISFGPLLAMFGAKTVSYRSVKKRVCLLANAAFILKKGPTERPETLTALEKRKCFCVFSKKIIEMKLRPCYYYSNGLLHYLGASSSRGKISKT